MKSKTKDENIIRFPGRSQGAQTPSKQERKAALAEEQFKRSDANARKIVTRKFADRTLKLKESERFTVACNLWQILCELEQDSPSVSKRDVLHEAGLVRGSTNSTNRLYYFAFNASKLMTPDKKARRIKALAQKISTYVKIVRAAAKLSRKDEWILIQRLIDGTSYSPLQKDIDAVDTDINDEGWDNVVEAIQAASTKVASKYNLPHFFKLVRGRVDRLAEIELAHEIVDGRAKIANCIDKFNQRTSCSPKQLDLEDTLLPALLRADNLPPRPSVYLGEIRLCEDIPCTIHLHPLLLPETWPIDNKEQEEEREVEFRARLLESRPWRPICERGGNSRFAGMAGAASAGQTE